MRFVFGGGWSCCAQRVATLPVLVGTRQILLQQARTHYMYEYQRFPQANGVASPKVYWIKRISCLCQVPLIPNSLQVLFAHVLSESHTKPEQISSCQRQLIQSGLSLPIVIPQSGQARRLHTLAEFHGKWLGCSHCSQGICIEWSQLAASEAWACEH